MPAVDDGLDDFYHLLYPAGLVLVTSADANGKANIITAAWCCPLSFDPPMVGVSIGKTRYSHQLIGKGKEFVLNTPGEGMETAVMVCGTTSGRNVDKFAEAKLTAEKAKFVKSPLIAECISSIECKVEKEIDCGDHTFFIGSVVAVHKRKEGKRIYDTGGRKFVSL